MTRLVSDRNAHGIHFESVPKLSMEHNRGPSSRHDKQLHPQRLVLRLEAQSVAKAEVHRRLAIEHRATHREEKIGTAEHFGGNRGNSGAARVRMDHTTGVHAWHVWKSNVNQRGPESSCTCNMWHGAQRVCVCVVVVWGWRGISGYAT